MSKFVEEGFYLAQGEQGWFIICGLGEVHHHTDMWTYVLALSCDPLSLVFGHPCATLLAFAGMEICIEYGEIASVVIKHLVGFYVWMIDGNVFVFAESDAVEFIGESEYTFYHL